MENKKIAIDCDGVLSNFNSGIIKFINETEGTNFEITDIDHWHWYRKSKKIQVKAMNSGLVNKLGDNWFNIKHKEFCSEHGLASLPIIPGSKEFLNELAKAYEIFVITDRPILDKNPYLTQEDTILWLSYNFGSSFNL